MQESTHLHLYWLLGRPPLLLSFEDHYFESSWTERILYGFGLAQLGIHFLKGGLAEGLKFV